MRFFGKIHCLRNYHHPIVPHPNVSYDRLELPSFFFNLARSLQHGVPSSANILSRPHNRFVVPSVQFVATVPDGHSRVQAMDKPTYQPFPQESIISFQNGIPLHKEDKQIFD